MVKLKSLLLSACLLGLSACGFATETVTNPIARAPASPEVEVPENNPSNYSISAGAVINATAGNVILRGRVTSMTQTTYPLSSPNLKMKTSLSKEF